VRLRKLVRYAVALLVTVQAVLSWVNTVWSALGNGSASGLFPEFGRSLFLTALTVLLFLALSDRIQGGFRLAIISTVALELIAVGIFQIVFGALSTLLFPVPLLLIVGGLALPFCIRRS
jgi:hypothetical protein